MVFYIFSRIDKENINTNSKKAKVLENIIKKHLDRNYDLLSLSFFTDIFRIDDYDLIHSVLESNDWKGDPREVYEPIIKIIRKYNILLYPISYPIKNLSFKEESLKKRLQEKIFDNFWELFKILKSRINFIDINQEHVSYFISQLNLKKDELEERKYTYFNIT